MSNVTAAVAEIGSEAYFRIVELERLNAELQNSLSRMTIRAAAYEEAYGIAYKATYQSHNGHWDSTMRGGLGCRECIRAREARENCDAALRSGLDALISRAAVATGSDQ